jgi:glucose/arabinose dehydrogenase
MNRQKILRASACVCLLALAGCDDHSSPDHPIARLPAHELSAGSIVTSDRGTLSVELQPIAKFDLPYAVAILPDGDMLVIEYGGIRMVSRNGAVVPGAVTGVPSSFIAPFDIILDPDYVQNHRIFVSYAEHGPGDPNVAGANVDLGEGYNLAVLSGALSLTEAGGNLTEVKVIWRQPNRFASGQYGGHLAFSPDGRYLFITSGDRSTFPPVESRLKRVVRIFRDLFITSGDSQLSPAQDVQSTIGKIVRIFPNGDIPSSNPFSDVKGAARDIWTLGHRNQYGLAFDKAGMLWEHENGPKGGDELNLIEPGKNYGWPKVSWGDHYNGSRMPKPKPGDGYVLPVVDWTPAIAPSGMIIYSGDLFKGLAGRAVIGGLRSEGLVIVRLNGISAEEEDRIDLNTRIRDVRQGLNGELWVLEDRPSGRLLKLTPGRASAPPVAAAVAQ